MNMKMMRCLMLSALLGLGVRAQATFELVASDTNVPADQRFNLNGGGGASSLRPRTLNQCADICRGAPSYESDGETVTCVGFNYNTGRRQCFFRRSLENGFAQGGIDMYQLTGLPTNAPTVLTTNSPTTKATNSPTVKATKSPTVPPTKEPTSPPTTKAPTAAGKIERRCGNKGKIDGVCGFTPVNAWNPDTGQGECIGVKVSYKRAVKICESQGAGSRLCTSQEIREKVAKSTGCGLNNKLVWSSSKRNCGRNGLKLLPGSGSNWTFKWLGEYDSNGKRLWIRDKRTRPACAKIKGKRKAFVRCCVTDTTFTADDGTDYYEGISGDF